MHLESARRVFNECVRGGVNGKLIGDVGGWQLIKDLIGMDDDFARIIRGGKGGWGESVLEYRSNYAIIRVMRTTSVN